MKSTACAVLFSLRNAQVPIVQKIKPSPVGKVSPNGDG